MNPVYQAGRGADGLWKIHPLCRAGRGAEALG